MASYKLFSFDKIPSTQTYALNMIADGKMSDHTIILAEAQSAGRGRYKRQWISHHGNLYVSFVFKIEERNPKLSYQVAVAIAETILSFGIKPVIKWPNDILIDDKKVSGTIIEYSGDFVVVGIGININSNPTVESYETTKLADYKKVNRDELLNKLTKNIDKWMNTDFKFVRSRWMDLACQINKKVKYRGNIMDFIEINENGALVLRNGDKYVMVYGDEIGG